MAAFATLTTAMIIVAATTFATSFTTIITTAIVMITPPFPPMIKSPIISAMVGKSFAVALATMVVVAATTIAHLGGVQR